MTADRESRRIAVEHTEESIAVEASAGTGKTRTLIDRVLHLVLRKGPDGRPLTLREICAITFTEKAAGEMKIRLRHELERRSTDTEEPGELARQRLQELDAAAISTFHAFAVSLLKERPFEAGLDPNFVALDDVQGEIYFREVWDAYLERIIEERDPIFEGALRMGMRLEALQELARTLWRHCSAVRELRLQPPVADEEVRQQVSGLLVEGRGLAAMALDENDKLYALLEEARDWLANPAARTPSTRSPGSVGARRAWRDGEDSVRLVRGFVSRVNDLKRIWAILPQQRLLDKAIHWLIDQFLPEWEARKRSHGFLDFDDQLRVARDLLKASRAARREFQKRYRTLLVDEFQDTDSLQLEILLLLTCTDLDETDPRRLKPAPGRLFVVGDPKQSIYRFRGADIETYEEVVEEQRLQRLGLHREPLTTNMRSVPSILRFVDGAFTDIMKRPDDGRYQPAYLAFGGPGLRADEHEPPSVHILGDRNGDGDWAGSGSGFFKAESSRIARLIRKMCNDSVWMVEDAPSGAQNPLREWRTPKFGDIAILLPVLTRADILEEALREADIPYVLEGGKFYYARSEVSSAITVLRAVANPNDGVALYGALRSIFFGLSDEDLLQAHIQGLPLDYRSPAPAGSLLAGPYEILRDLHLHRHDRSAAETFEVLLHKTGAREVLARRGFQSLANLGKLGRTLRSLQRERAFSQVVDLVGTMDEEGMAESESRLTEEHGDAVRVMSIHRSKGLDFPIAFVAGLGFRMLNRSGDFLADAHEQKSFAVRVRSDEGSLHTPGWEAHQAGEKKREDAELIRLIYVALTRARDHLVLCTHHKGKLDSATGEWLQSFKGTRLGPLSDFLCSDAVKGGRLVRLVEVRGLEELAGPRRAEGTAPAIDWHARLRNEYRELHHLIAETPHSRGRIAAAGPTDELAAEERPADTARARAVRLGIAFHEAMENIDLRTAANLEQCMERAAAKHRLDGAGIREMREMMNRCLAAPLMQRVRAIANSGGKLWRELPFIRPMPEGNTDVLEEGKIDLLFHDEEGWVLIDYKTDRIELLAAGADAALRSQYSGQITEYVNTLTALGVKVRAAYLLMARTGTAIEVWPRGGGDREGSTNL
jgi:ATP-dependent exoDNAse (exonuclease V) beta subunit